MKLILQIALRTRKHLTLVICAFLALLALTVANQLEMFSLGLMTRSALPPVEQEVKEDLKEKNPLAWVMEEAKSRLDFSSDVRAMVAVLVVVAIYKAITLFFSRYASQLLAIRISRDLRQQYFEHIQALPMSFYQRYNIGSLSSRVVSDAAQIAEAMNSCITNFLQAPFTLISTITFCFIISWKLSIVIFFGLPAIVLPMIFFAKKVKKIARQLLKNQEKFATVLIDFLAGIQTVKIFGMERFSFKKYEEQNDRMAHLETKSIKYALMIRPILHAVTTFCLATVIVFGLYVLKIPLSQLIVFSGLLHLLYEPTKKFAEENVNIQKGIAAAERMFEVLDLRSDVEDHAEAAPLTQFTEKLSFKDVSFRYNDEWVLKDVNFSIRKGETVAIVGPTGSGKSTIAKLIPRLYDVEKGKIEIDGKPISDYTIRSVREQVSFVSQKPFFFLDSISSNICYGRNFSPEEILRAAKAAHAHEFIDRLPDKYLSLLDEAGSNLSGGQQQRLAIARALIKKAPILIFDEATSALDSLSEHKIKETIEELRGLITQIIITHRFSVIDHVDRILYLEGGQILAQGTREELLASCPPFQLAWETYYSTRDSVDLV